MPEDRVVIGPRGVERLRSGHHWVYRSDVRGVDAEPGAVVRLLDERGRFHGRAFYSDRSQISIRLVTADDVAVDRAFLRQRLLAAAEFRKRTVTNSEVYRLVYGEADANSFSRRRSLRRLPGDAESLPDRRAPQTTDRRTPRRTFFAARHHRAQRPESPPCSKASNSAYQCSTATSQKRYARVRAASNTSTICITARKPAASSISAKIMRRPPTMRAAKSSIASRITADSRCPSPARPRTWRQSIFRQPPSLPRDAISELNADCECYIPRGQLLRSC